MQCSSKFLNRNILFLSGGVTSSSSFPIQYRFDMRLEHFYDFVKKVHSDKKGILEMRRLRAYYKRAGTRPDKYLCICS